MLYQDVILADRPVGYWPLGGTRDLVAGRNATGVNSPTFGSPGLMIAGAQAGRCVDLNGSNQYLTVADNDVFSPTASAWSVECWVRFDNLPSVFMALVAKYESSATEWGLNILGPSAGVTNTVEYIIWNSGGGEIWKATAPANSLSTGRIFHFVGTFNNGAPIIIYINGTERARNTSTTGGTRSNTTSKIWMGHRGDGAGSHTDGRLAHVAVYDKVLSPAQIVSHYRAGVVGIPAGLAA